MKKVIAEIILIAIVVACFFGCYYTVNAYRHHAANVELNILEKAVEAYANAPMIDVMPIAGGHKRKDIDSR